MYELFINVFSYMLMSRGDPGIKIGWSDLRCLPSVQVDFNSFLAGPSGADTPARQCYALLDLRFFI